MNSLEKHAGYIPPLSFNFLIVPEYWIGSARAPIKITKKDDETSIITITHGGETLTFEQNIIWYELNKNVTGVSIDLEEFYSRLGKRVPIRYSYHYKYKGPVRRIFLLLIVVSIISFLFL